MANWHCKTTAGQLIEECKTSIKFKIKWTHVEDAN